MQQADVLVILISFECILVTLFTSTEPHESSIFSRD